MKDVLIATDAILAIIIGKESKVDEEIIKKARKGEYRILIEHCSLYWALYSVREGDNINLKRLAELLKYAQILSEELVDPRARESWTPSQEEVEHWRKVALEES